ncbi:unnamed protein product [Rotaria socialis]
MEPVILNGDTNNSGSSTDPSHCYKMKSSTDELNEQRSIDRSTQYVELRTRSHAEAMDIEIEERQKKKLLVELRLARLCYHAIMFRT